MDIGRKCNYISNAFYNKGLRLAGERNLTGSAECMKKALSFNKRNTNARNLLGLIYFEMGEVADALCQWVISLNFQPASNDADRYLDEIQRKPTLLESYSLMIRRFNKVLANVQGGSSDDMGVSHLTKLTTEYPNYVRAQLLLAAICLSNEEYSKASKALTQVLRVDKGNTKALQYLNFLKSIKGKGQKGRSKLRSDSENENIPSDVIIPSSYKEQTAFQTAINIILGLLIGAAAVFFLYMPTQRSQMANEYNEKLVSTTNKLNSANIDYARLEDELEQLQAEYDELEARKGDIDTAYAEKLLQYQRLAQCYSHLKQDDFISAAKIYAGIDGTLIEDVPDTELDTSAKQLYDQLKFLMEEDGYVRVAQYGDEEYEAGNYDKALEYYDLSIAVKDNPAATYKKGKCYVQKEDFTTANQIFTEVIEKWPDTEVAEMARADRGF